MTRKKNRHRRLSGAATLLLLAGCAAPPLQPPVVYDCEDGLQLRVRFASDRAEVALPDGTVLTLPQQPAASGIWYSSGQHELRGKGREARWTVGRRIPTNCFVLDGAPAR
ncbi:MliC family protein [Aquincola sp. MAHUQ-54]|uniref:MliC family protein n=1 Tax=Aquincola agrisoli TaxID=3119538 RepID=A0AAW9QM03_9BURK